MENEVFSEEASTEEIVNKIADLASSQEESALTDLRKLLRSGLHFSGDDFFAVSRLATRALLQKGKPGVEILSSAALDPLLDSLSALKDEFNDDPEVLSAIDREIQLGTEWMCDHASDEHERE